MYSLFTVGICVVLASQKPHKAAWLIEIAEVHRIVFD